MFRHIAASCTLLLIITSTPILFAETSKKPCTREDAIRAEGGAASLKTWREVYQAYNEFGQCDNGGIGEGYSESVARLLTDGWPTIGELNHLAAQNKGFKGFVLHHVDELMTPTQAQQIEENATERCPSASGRLCKSIISRLHETPSEK